MPNGRMKLKIKKFFLLNIATALFLLISFSVNALTMREKIQQDLSKIGLNNKIILETEDLYIEYFESDFRILDEEVKDKIEKLLKRDERNFYLSEILLNHYSMSKELSEDKNSKRNIQKYFDLYKKYSFYDYLKYYYENLSPSYNKSIYQKMKQEYSGTIFEKIAKIWEKSVEKEIEKTGLTEEESRLIEEIFVEIDKKEIQEQFRLSEEEVFNLKLEIQLVKIENYFYKKEYEKGIDYYLSIANVEKENLKKYALFNQEVMWFVVASNVGNLETFEKAKEKINKLEALEIYRKIKY
ncbi:hypothetical protein [uncultured Leptotrichia sp.]|uniref:hypothetical protein n=1 Tax=uncultured Leptotrichia sp. TaxID=159271 RepID=UPI002629E862|nr:hypothetical protein [uncultured Leptotrichia sp.]